MKILATKRLNQHNATESGAGKTAAYIAEMCKSLATIAEGADLRMLGYFLRLAELEAGIAQRGADVNYPAAGGGKVAASNPRILVRAPGDRKRGH